MQLVIALMSIVLAKVAAERPTAGKIGGDCRENHWTNTKLSTMTASNGAIGFDTTETPGSDYTCDDPDNVFCAMPQPAPYPNGGTIPRTCMKLPPTNSDGNYFDGKYCVTFEEYGNLRPGYVEVLGDGVAYLFRACGGYQWVSPSGANIPGHHKGS